jgi:hypothetical protein
VRRTGVGATGRPSSDRVTTSVLAIPRGTGERDGGQAQCTR